MINLAYRAVQSVLPCLSQSPPDTKAGAAVSIVTLCYAPCMPFPQKGRLGMAGKYGKTLDCLEHIKGKGWHIHPQIQEIAAWF